MATLALDFVRDGLAGADTHERIHTREYRYRTQMLRRERLVDLREFAISFCHLFLPSLFRFATAEDKWRGVVQKHGAETRCRKCASQSVSPALRDFAISVTLQKHGAETRCSKCARERRTLSE